MRKDKAKVHTSVQAHMQEIAGLEQFSIVEICIFGLFVSHCVIFNALLLEFSKQFSMQTEKQYKLQICLIYVY